MRAVILAAAMLVAAAPPDRSAPPLLGQVDLDPRLILPPPPAPDSAQAKAELAELHAMQIGDTASDRAAADAEGKVKDASIFADAVPGFDLSRLPANARLFAMVRASEKIMVDLGKSEFKRPRPWIVDATITHCSTSEDPLSSYPSGHTTSAFAMAGVLARLIPARAPAIFARAAHYGQSRIVCEQHFRSDVTSGEALGLLIAERLMAKPAFATAFAAARAELVEANIIER